MSLLEFQAALAALIRCPNPNRDPAWRERWLSKELSPQQIDSLETLSMHSELNKYGREQREQRWEFTWGKIWHLRWLFDEEFLHKLCVDLFEPQHMTVPGDLSSSAASYTNAFLEFLMHSPEAQARLKAEAPAFVFDVIAFEKAQIILDQVAAHPLPLPKDSVLAHGHLRILAQDHDITNWLESLKSLPRGAELPHPEARKNFLLLVRDGDHKPFQIRIFEIDAENYRFIQGELGPQSRQPVTQSLLNDLNTMGLYSQKTS